MIKIENVSMLFSQHKPLKSYLLQPFRTSPAFRSLNSINLNIDLGDRVAFIGLNGAGKTTLLKLIGGLLYPTDGAISINGFDTVRENLKARANVGYVLNEERSFYWRLTGTQNLQFFGALDNMYGTTLETKMRHLIKMVGLETVSDKLVATYSSGMKQRLAIARGLLCDPKILILDEPTRTLDPEAVQDVKRLISQKIHEDEQRTLLIATHRFDEVDELCNKVCIMRGGEMLAYKTLQEIKENYQSVSEFYQMVMNGKEEVFV